MFKKSIVFASLLVLMGSASAFAQEPKVEISGFAGWAFSDGVSADTPVLIGGTLYDRVDPKDGFLWGLSGGVLVNENAEVGFLYSSQASNLVIGGTNPLEAGDMTVSTYHGYFAYNFGPSDSSIRPFILVGLGATHFGSVDTTVGVNRTVSGEAQFSTTWAAGVKVFPGPHAGLRLAARWTPTYIKSDASGWWCDPYWGCYVVGNAQYSNQFELSGGVVVRF